MAIRAVRSFLLIMPIVAIYWQAEGLLIQDIFLLQVIFSVAVVILEIPSGYFADVFGRKGSIVLGTLAGTIGYVLYFLAGSFWTFALAEVVLAISIAFISGADSAFLYDTLKQHGATDRHVKYEGRILALIRLSEAAAALLCGVIVAMSSLKAVFLWQVVIMALSIPIAFSLKEPTLPVEHTARKNIIQIVRFITHENKRLLHLNIFSGVITASTLCMVWFSQPYWLELKINPAHFGFLWAGLNVLVSVGAYGAHLLERNFSFRALFVIFAFAPLILYGLLASGLGLYALLVIPLFWIFRGIYHPIMLDYIHRETESSIRATVVSASQLFGRFWFSILSPLLGWVADLWSLETAFLASALIFGILAIASCLVLLAHMKGVPTGKAQTP